MEIRSKKEFYKLWEDGVLGNKLRTWRDPVAAQASGVSLVGFRYADPKGGGAPWWGICKGTDIVTRFAEIVATGFDARYLVVCEAAPDDRGTIQGEVCRTYLGLRGYLGLTTGLRMRDAMAAGLLKNYGGAAVNVLLDRYMDPSSRDDLDQIMDRYPDATVEFTCYAVQVGAFPHRNTIFWEVRNY